MKNPPRIGVILPNWIGDVVMATPTLRALRNHFGSDAIFTGVMRPYVAEVLQGTPWLNESVLYDRRSPDKHKRLLGVAGQLRKRSFDWLFVLPNSLSSATLAWLSGAKRRVGYARNGRRWLLTDLCYAPRDGKQWRPISAVDYYLRLASAVGRIDESRQLELATSPQDEQTAAAIWRDFAFEGKTVVAFNTGSAAGGAKDWPIEYFTALAQKTTVETDTSVLILCGPKEREQAARIERELGNPRVRSMAGQDLSLGVARACIRRSDVMVTTDSGPRHVAAAFAVPTVALFGPIEPRWSVNYNPREISLWERVDCAPCGQYVCPLAHHRCMKELSVKRVWGCLQRQLSEIHASRLVA